jgi:hypothetical protein
MGNNEKHVDQPVDASEEVSPKQDGLVILEPGAPTPEVTSKRQSLSDIFTIICAGFALISDGYQNNLMFVFFHFSVSHGEG